MKILSLSGFVPEAIVDTIRFWNFSGERSISHYCGYASDYISNVLNDSTIDGAVYPKSCDSTRIITSYLKDSGKFLYQLNVPSYGVIGAEKFLEKSIIDYKDSVERHFELTITDDEVRQRATLVNERNTLINNLYTSIDSVSYSLYMRTIHDALMVPLESQCKVFEKEINQGKAYDSNKRVFIVGSSLTNVVIVDYIEKIGLKVVGDTLPESGRLVSSPKINISDDIYTEISKSMLRMRMSPTQNGFRNIIEKDIEEIKSKAVKGVVFIMQKYCEPYEFLYSVYKPCLDNHGIKSLKISLNEAADIPRIETQLEAFADTL